MPGRISLALLPAAAVADEHGCFIVVDTLRATTTIATLFAAGVGELWVASDIERARALAAEHEATLIGEVHGLPPPGFAFGNSPVELMAGAAGIGRVILFTTNGTRALCGFATHGSAYAGALVNATAVAEAVRGSPSVTVVCAGESGGQRFAIEDFAAAASIVRRLHEATPDAQLDDGAMLGLAAGAESASALIRGANHAETLRQLGLADDIAFACQEDAMSCVPKVVEAGPGWALLRDASVSA